MQMSSGLDEHFASTTVRQDQTSPIVSQLCLVVVGPSISLTIPLPPGSEISIGREGTTLVVRDPQVSRRHARLFVSQAGEVSVEDLSSVNGTSIAGRTLRGETTRLHPGEAAVVGETFLLLQRASNNRRAMRIWPHGYFVARTEEECLRNAELGTEFSVIRFRLGESPDELSGIVDTIERIFGWNVIIGTLGERDYEVLSPSCDLALARARLAETRASLRTSHIGFASCPQHGRSADSLIERCSASMLGLSLDIAAHGTDVVVRDEALSALYQVAGRAAHGLVSILITGESGVGKDVLARWIHDHSDRSAGPFVEVNMPTVAENVFEAELFGSRRGAFTGAVDRKGLLAEADGGTVFLNEIGELPLATQSKLLQAVETRRIRRVGDTADRIIDVRWIAATNRNLMSEIAGGKFRQDLYHRLAVVCFHVPPLRERFADIEPLANQLLRVCVARAKRQPVPVFSRDAMLLLEAYEWPGNIRELANVIDYALVVSNSASILPEHLPDRLRAQQVSSPLTDHDACLEKQDILRSLEASRWRIAEAARLMNRSRTWLWAKMKEHSIAPTRKRRGVQSDSKV